MAYRMAYLSKRIDSSHHMFRLRTPADVLARGGMSRRVMIQVPEFMGGSPLIAAATIGREIKFSLRTRSNEEAEFRRSVAVVELNKVFAAIRNGPQQLSHMQLLGLARAVHELYVGSFQNDPGANDIWVAHKALNRAVSEGRIRDVTPIVPGQLLDERETATALFGEDLTAGINALPRSNDAADGLEMRFGLLVDWLLTQNGLIVERETRTRLLAMVAKATDSGSRRLKDNIAGDYGDDHRLARYPVYKPRNGRTFSQAFDDWIREANPAASTRSTWRGHLKSLREFLQHDEIARLRHSDVVSWKDHLVERALVAKTINDGYLASLSTILNFEVQNGRLQSNIAEGVKARHRDRAGASRLPYTRDEAGRLLELAKGESHPNLRWLPWLAAMSGSRIGEVAQLWGQRIVIVEGLHVMRIAPAEDGGRLKNAWSERDVPLHPAIIEQGFLDFVQERGDGPLFYQRTSGDPARAHASKSVAGKVAAWVRAQSGFRDRRKDPSHAFRHWFKSELAAAGVQDSLADGIVGHGKRSVADHYRHFSIQTKAEAIRRVSAPRPSRLTQNGC